jgi:hypothetical protein
LRSGLVCTQGLGFSFERSDGRLANQLVAFAVLDVGLTV